MGKLRNVFKARFVPLAVAAVAMGGLSVASAVSLGVSANNELGAGTSVTASCQPAGGTAGDIAVGFNTPVYSASGYAVDTLKLTNVAATCNGRTVKATVADANHNALASLTGTITGTTVTFPLGSQVAASNVGSVSIVVY